MIGTPHRHGLRALLLPGLLSSGLLSLGLLLMALVATAGADIGIGAPVGGFVRVSGEVLGALPNQQPESKSAQSPAFFGENVTTGADSSATIGFIDHSHLLISQHTSITIDKLVFNPKSSFEEAAYTLTEGTARLVSGAIAGDSLEINTPHAKFFVRGTNVKLRVIPDKHTLVSVNTGEVHVTVAGSSDRTVVKAGQSTTIDDQGIGAVADAELPMGDALIDHPSLDGKPVLPHPDLGILGFTEAEIAAIEAALKAALGDDTDAGN